MLASVEARIETRRELEQQLEQNFNVFRVLGLEQSEEGLHSRFLEHLLNPKGSHGLRSVFLQLFLEQIGDLVWTEGAPKRRIPATTWIDATAATVKREYVIGPVEGAGSDSKGGRIDIFITDPNHDLSIENKIGSEEGDEQVTRYCNHQHERNFVLFLTLEGSEAKTNKPNYAPISYPGHIVPWLEACKRECADFPILRETITQYITIVRELTGRPTMRGSDEKIRESTRRNYRAALAIRGALDELVRSESATLVQEVCDRITEDAGDEWTIEIEDLEKRSKGLLLTRKRWGNIQVRWEGYPISRSSGTGIRQGEPGTAKWSNWKMLEECEFENETGLEHLFERRNKLIGIVVDRLRSLAEQCDKEFDARSA